MSDKEITRWDDGGSGEMEIVDDGDWIGYEDYATLETKNDALKAELAELKGDLERSQRVHRISLSVQSEDPSDYGRRHLSASVLDVGHADHAYSVGSSELDKWVSDLFARAKQAEAELDTRTKERDVARSSLINVPRDYVIREMFESVCEQRDAAEASAKKAEANLELIQKLLEHSDGARGGE